ncbi:hypothetical protein LPB138_10060 [Urechidicola croceus]|uniref:Fibronectin type-III domain-containing protein n=2 Tax=Urechidicola croceus TaxID=1850246 RepID=A0A1D8P8T8_9FLAO|nr:hypothetical protein LPB138_10060 [Urechidicola croceus]
MYAQYCEPTISPGGNFYISSVKVADKPINNSTFESGFVSDYTALEPAFLTVGGIYYIYVETIRPLNQGSNIMIWIDFDGDGSFDETNELLNTTSIPQGESVTNYAFNYSIIIPDGVPTGETRLRIAMRSYGLPDAAAPNPCGVFYTPGEVEDYTVHIRPLAVAPTASCIGNLDVTLDVLGNATITPADIDNGSADDYDPYSDLIFTLDKDQFNCDDIGANTVTLTVEDLDGLSDSCTANVNVIAYSGPFQAPVFEDVTTYCSYIAETPVMNFQCNEEIIATTTDQTSFTSAGSYSINWSFDNGVTTEITTQNVTVLSPTVPTNVSVSSITETSAVVTWDAQVNANYTFLYRATGLGAWTQIITDTNSIELTSLDDGTEYEFQVSVSPTCAGFSAIQTFETIEIDYCDGTEVNIGYNSNYYISNVIIPNVNNSTTANGSPYSYYPEFPAVLEVGEEFTGNVTYLRQAYNITTLSIWIDYNNDGDFEDADEEIFTDFQSGTPTNTFTLNFTNILVPATATLGKTRLRVGLRHNGYPTSACSFDYQNGEIEDYDVYLVDKSDTDGDTVFDLFDLDDDNDGITDDFEKPGDADGDGILNYLDLDSDNDGIPDVVEAGGTDADKDGMADGAVGTNGIPSSAGTGLTPINTDADTTPDYLDLDSDNDGLFDVVEYDGIGSSDIDLDGVGDGSDDDSDGILNAYDDLVGFGFMTYFDPIDVTDGDGIPNYIDITSDGSSFDILGSNFAAEDGDGDGDIDGTIDVDEDGILDIVDTDPTVFGSPSDIEIGASLYFNGINAYVEDFSIMDDWSEVTLMTWIKLESGSSGERVVAGQDNFNLVINNAGFLEATIGGTTITSLNAITEDIWVHVAAIYQSGLFELYVNGIDGITDTSVSGNLPADSSNFTIGKTPNVNGGYFQGEIDELRLFNIALTQEQLQSMMCQELDDENTFQGAMIPTITDSYDETTLILYFKMNSFNGPILDNNVTPVLESSGATVYNISSMPQTAPLPYVTIQSGDWTDVLAWEHGDVWDISTKVDPTDDGAEDGTIVHIKHLITTSDTHSVFGLVVDPISKLSVQSDKALYVNRYFKLDGILDLEGESQLIQTSRSILDTSSAGMLERDQQGTANSFTYNYWSAPVSAINTTSNNLSYNIQDVLFDGSNPSTPIDLDFDPAVTLSNTDPFYADGAETSPRKIATYWFWKFVNSGNDYANWEWVGGDNTINVTEGFSMKGISGASAIDAEQNYVFIGKPNNAPEEIYGDMVHTTFPAGTTPEGYTYNSLTGNPFPSALDADKFIDDNETTTTGELFFWEHWGGGNHNWADYRAGYSVYTKATGVPAAAHPDGAGGLEAGSKTPGQYVPVGQAFYVISSGAGGPVVFKNSQRVFKVELDDIDNDDHSIFTRSNDKTKGNQNVQNRASTESREIEKQVIRLGFESPVGYHRQVAVAFLEGATDEIDHGYDGKAGDFYTNDAFFIQDDTYLVIQAFGEFDEDREIPISIFIDEENNGGLQKIMVDGLKNIPESTNIFIKDNLTGLTHDIKYETFEVNLETGEHKDRFLLVFKSQVLSLEESGILDDKMTIYLNKSQQTIGIIKTADVTINKASLFNYLGQEMQVWNKNLDNSNLQLPLKDLSTGAYILKVETDSKLVTKKLIIE